MPYEKKLAKIIRILTIPSFMVSILLLIIYLNPRNVFIDKIDLLIAFYFSIVGYSLGTIYYKQSY